MNSAFRESGPGPVAMALLLAILLVGAALRLYQLDGQILTGDEWHALHKVIASDYAGIAGSFGAADHTIPLTLYFEFLSNNGGLGHWGIYLPFILSGLLALVLIPLCCRRYAATGTVLLLAALLASSPFLIGYSRFARPYMPAVLLSFLAVWCFFRWREDGLRRHALGYLIAAVASCWLLLAYLPFVFAPFLYFLPLDVRSRRVDWRTFRALFVLGLATLGLLLLLIGPALVNDFAALDRKMGITSVSAPGVYQALMLLLGGPGLPLTTPLLLLALAGLFAAWRERQYFLLYLALLAGLQLLTVWLLAPRGAGNPAILARYLLPLLPPLLLLISRGLSGLLLLVFPGRHWPRAAPAAAFVLLLAFGGVLPQLYYSPNNAFVLNLFAQWRYRGEAREEILLRRPAFYAGLAAQEPGSVRLLEVPFQYNRDHFFLYQQEHRQRIAAGLVNGLCGEPVAGAIPRGFPVRPGNFFYLDDPAMLAGQGLDFVVYHKLNRDEVNYPQASPPDIDVGGCIERYRQWLGEPYFEDRDLVVFALDSRG